jgi:type IV pilus assembly protein PilO
VNFRDPRTQKILLAAILVVGLFVVYFGLNLLPFGYQARAAEIKTLKEEYAQISSKVNQARRLAADLPRVEARHAATQKRWEAANELLPPSTAMADFLRQMTIVGQQSGVEFVRVEPANSTNYEYYAENPVHFTVIGGYHEVGTFLGEIAALSRLVTVRMLSLTSVEGGDEGETLRAGFRASAYSVSGSHVRATQGSAMGRPGTDVAEAGAKPAAKAATTPAAKPRRNRGH